MVLQDDSKPSIIYKINDNLFFLPFMMTIVKFFFTYHTVNKMDIVDWNNVHVIKYLFFPKNIVSTIN